MKTSNFCLTVLLVLATTHSVFCQSDSLIVEKKRFGSRSKFQIDNTTLSIKELNQKYSQYADAHAEFVKAKKNKTASIVFGLSGVALTGYFIAKGNEESKHYQPAPIIIGAGLLGVAIGFGSGYNKKARKAMNIYNAHVSRQR